MKAGIISLEGKVGADIELPIQFDSQVDDSLIKRAVLAIQSAAMQIHYPFILAGRNNTALYVGSRGKPTMYRTINVGHARKPRLKNRRGLLQGQVAGIPGVVTGPRAHPPKSNKIYAEKINKKEKRKATASAIAATAKAELAKARGHIFSEKLKFPIIVEAKIENLAKTKDIIKAFEQIGVLSDVEKAKAKKQIRAGKVKNRGKVYKKRKSILIVAENAEKIFKAARNIEGVDVIAVKDVNADLLAPGGVPGRLTLWSESAIRTLSHGKKVKEKATIRAATK